MEDLLLEEDIDTHLIGTEELTNSNVVRRNDIKCSDSGPFEVLRESNGCEMGYLYKNFSTPNLIKYV